MSLNTLFSESSTKSSKTSAKSSSKSAESSSEPIEVGVQVVHLAEASDAGLRRAEAVELRGGGGVGEAQNEEDEESDDLHAEDYGAWWAES